MKADKKDLLAGAIFCAFGLFFAVTAYFRLRLGTALNMGPGYFPVLIGGVLFVIGLVMMALALGRDSGAIRQPPWRAIALVIAAIVVFALSIDRLGFLPATAVTVLITAFASRTMTVAFALGLTAVLTAFCVALFHYGLGLALPLFGIWLGG